MEISSDAHYTHFLVDNQGKPIPEDQLNRIWERFSGRHVRGWRRFSGIFTSGLT
ncbi:hypothetical protein [Paenibacillus sp. IHB B 3415]|uniref:hypothetical protein n=1 Tax=Paenibacillus sp. IHB B 3415 TaxID=867080 RepID=UPI001F16C619|nr:hypothetical protein [Paenibacillus sp. IHB B 3415]